MKKENIHLAFCLILAFITLIVAILFLTKVYSDAGSHATVVAIASTVMAFISGTLFREGHYL